MQVSVQFAFSHFDDISEAIERGEVVEIVRPGKTALQLVSRSEHTPDIEPALEAGRRILGLGRGEFRVPSVEEWKVMDAQLMRQMNEAPLFPSE